MDEEGSVGEREAGNGLVADFGLVHSGAAVFERGDADREAAAVGVGGGSLLRVEVEAEAL